MSRPGKKGEKRMLTEKVSQNKESLGEDGESEGGVKQTNAKTILGLDCWWSIARQWECHW
jgi:hypothetical protein